MNARTGSPHPSGRISWLTPSLQSRGSALLGWNRVDELQFWPQHLIDLLQAYAERIIEKMGVPMCRLHLSLAEQSSNHRQGHPARNKQRCKCVAEVMNAHVGNTGLCSNVMPEPFYLMNRFTL